MHLPEISCGKFCIYYTLFPGVHSKTGAAVLWYSVCYVLSWGTSIFSKSLPEFGLSLYFRWLLNLCYQNSLLLLLLLPHSSFVTEVKCQHLHRWRTEAERVRGDAQTDSVADSQVLPYTIWVVVVGSVVWGTAVGFTKPLQSSGRTNWAELSTWWIKHWRFEICSRDLIHWFAVSVSKLNLSTHLQLF